MQIEIISHCFAGHHSHYAKSLWWQICSLADCPDVRLVVYASMRDGPTMRVVHHAQQRFDFVWSRPLDEPRLFRRAIGRNDAAFATRADLVWFTDCDHCFSPATFDALRSLAPQGPVWPCTIAISRSHAVGQADLDKVDLQQLEPVSVDARCPYCDGTGLLECGHDTIFWDEPCYFCDGTGSRFVPKHLSKAIGGVQIVPGDVCRRWGYLHATRWQQPVSIEGGFRSCRCDRAYRGWIAERGLPFEPIDLPGVYRLRHETKGRDHAKATAIDGDAS